MALHAKTLNVCSEHVQLLEANTAKVRRYWFFIPVGNFLNLGGLFGQAVCKVLVYQGVIDAEVCRRATDLILQAQGQWQVFWCVFVAPQLVLAKGGLSYLSVVSVFIYCSGKISFVFVGFFVPIRDCP